MRYFFDFRGFCDEEEREASWAKQLIIVFLVIDEGLSLVESTEI